MSHDIDNDKPNATFGCYIYSKALFSSEKFWKINTVALSFVFDKYYLIMD